MATTMAQSQKDLLTELKMTMTSNQEKFETVYNHVADSNQQIMGEVQTSALVVGGLAASVGLAATAGIWYTLN